MQEFCVIAVQNSIRSLAGPLQRRREADEQGGGHDPAEPRRGEGTSGAPIVRIRIRLSLTNHISSLFSFRIINSTVAITHGTAVSSNCNLGQVSFKVVEQHEALRDKKEALNLSEKAKDLHQEMQTFETLPVAELMANIGKFTPSHHEKLDAYEMADQVRIMTRSHWEHARLLF